MVMKQLKTVKSDIEYPFGSFIYYMLQYTGTLYVDLLLVGHFPYVPLRFGRDYWGELATNNTNRRSVFFSKHPPSHLSS